MGHLSKRTRPIMPKMGVGALGVIVLGVCVMRINPLWLRKIKWARKKGTLKEYEQLKRFGHVKKFGLVKRNIWARKKELGK